MVIWHICGNINNMNIEEQFEIEHLFLSERKCRICGITKDLIDGFYLTRKDRGTLSSSYAYECKECSIKRIQQNRKNNYKEIQKLEYPDW